MQIVHEIISTKYRYNAGSKARNDIEEILRKNGVEILEITNTEMPERDSKNILDKIIMHHKVYKIWKTKIMDIPDGSTIIIQFPLFLHTVFFGQILKLLHRKKCFIIAFIHDLEMLRLVSRKERNKLKTNQRLLAEERNALPLFDIIIAHNKKMKDILVDQIGIDKEKIRTISIFDYLIPDYEQKIERDSKSNKNFYSIIIAGNLSVDKSGYIYKLPDNCKFELYGANYDGSSKSNITYKGSFLPEELPFHLKGSFGLVWDGTETDTCTGVYGDYLRYNNPHKTSLYLACGLPVIIWQEAAMAEYISQNNCGILVDSLDNLNNILSKINEEEYKKMKLNAENIGKKLRNGTYTNAVINSIQA